MPKVSTIVRSLVFVAAIVTASCAGDPPATGPTLLPAHGTPAKIELNATPGIGAHGGQAAVTARVLDAYALLLPDVDVTFSADAGAFDAMTARTNSAGLATSVLKADPGVVKVRATAGGIQAAEAVVSIQPLNVVEPPPPSPPPPPPPPIPQPTPPQPSYGVTMVASPASVVTGAPTTISATVSQNFGAPAVTSWAWDCDTTTSSTDATTANSATCTYATVGTFTANVKVTGGTVVGFATTTVTVTAVPPPPSYTVSLVAAPASIPSGTSSTLIATVTPHDGAPAVTAWTWDCDTSATSTDFTTATTAMCAYPTSGTFTAKVTVTGGTVTGSATTTVVVIPAVPVVTVHCGQPTPPALTVNCNVSATLNGATVSTSDITHVDWDWADTGTSSSANALGIHTYTAASTYVIVARNVTVNGTTATGSGSVSFQVQ
jgi:PKD repeat protein